MIKIVFGCLLSILFLVRCEQIDTPKKEKSISRFNDIIDSAVIEIFYKNNAISDSIQKETNNFYKRRHHRYAWLSEDGLSYAVSIFHNQLQNYRYNFSDNSFYNANLDSFIIEARMDETKFLLQQNKIKKLELLLTTTFFKYAKKAYGGQANNLSDLEWFIPRQNKNYQSTLDSLVLISDKENEQIPLNKSYFLLKHQLKIYRDIEKNGGFPIVLASKHDLQIGNVDTNLVFAKKYFYMSGDLKSKDETIVFSESLFQAIKNFQQRMGLVVTGHLDSITTNELNRPVSFRIKQIMVNMERLRWAPVEMENIYLLINIPEFKLHYFDSNKQIWTTNIIVGRSATQTTIFKGNISQIILNTYWGIPTTIANKEIVPHIIKDTRYLAKKNIEVFSGNQRVNPSKINWNNYSGNVPFFFRQTPGKNNALGKIKFVFPNSYDIYLHDTPSKELFDDTNRDFSHGCIRVADPKRLALYLLEHNTEWNSKKINKILLTDNETTIPLAPTVPIYIMYYTAWVDNNGNLNFRKDIYDLDRKLSKQIFGE